jgi:holin-like protein
MSKMFKNISFSLVKHYVVGAAIILLLLYSGHFFSRFIPLPGPVLGLLLCALLCAILRQVPKPLLLISQLLLANMALFFVPLIVSATLYMEYIQDTWLIIVMSVITSTLVAMAVTALLADRNLTKHSKNTEL